VDKSGFFDEREIIMAIRKATTFVPNPNYSGTPNPDPAICDELMAVDVFLTSRETILRVDEMDELREYFREEGKSE
jgi:hypothetical protein